MQLRSRKRKMTPVSREPAETSASSQTPDMVLCGGCRASYPLAEIVRFIEHKVKECRAGGAVSCASPSPAQGAPEDSDPEDALAALRPSGVDHHETKLSSVPSISAPISSSKRRVESPPASTCADASGGSPIELRASSTPKRAGAPQGGHHEHSPDKDAVDATAKKPKTESVDADTNTVSSG
ncbi:hypothetical protein QAD02_023599 [Eretmocerus hayati]|uniref:Uncharacterized protein n=1 Tax=Eretmocerus hayati TaxID=131215 RepID=A0ACC2PW35_9HYME|nr:hypothetical protein QAD02_023599 [Eretmocerus hayati]